MARKFEQSDVNFSSLLGQLNTSGLNKENPALYQVISKLINGAVQLQDGLVNGNVRGPGSAVIGNIPIFDATDGSSLKDSGTPITLLRCETILTDAQIKDATAPYPIIVPNPNPKYQITPYWVIAFASLIAGYTNIHADAIIKLGDAVEFSNFLLNGNGTGFTNVTKFLNTNLNGYVIFRELTDTSAVLGNCVFAQPNSYAGQPIRWKLNNQGAGDLTGGDPLNSIKVVTYYSLESPV